MPGDEDDDFDYTTQDVGPRDPDRFEKRGKPDNSEGGDDRRTNGGREIRENR